MRNLITDYEKNRKRKTDSFQYSLKNIFDKIKKEGLWLYQEDK